MLPSPCKNICRMDEPSGYCVGCGRTLDEIELWSVLDDDDKRAVWALLPARMALLPPEAGSVAAGGEGDGRRAG